MLGLYLKEDLQHSTAEGSPHFLFSTVLPNPLLQRIYAQQMCLLATMPTIPLYTLLMMVSFRSPRWDPGLLGWTWGAFLWTT